MTSASHHQTVLHLDVDAFYVEAERLRHPHLKGKPVAVSQHNRGGFVAVSYEAKAKGIRKGDGAGERGRQAIEFLRHRLSLQEVYQKCPDITILVMDAPYYRSVTSRVEKALQTLQPQPNTDTHVSPSPNLRLVVEKCSLDDFLIDATREVEWMMQQIGDQDTAGKAADATPPIYRSLEGLFAAYGLQVSSASSGEEVHGLLGATTWLQADGEGLLAPERIAEAEDISSLSVLDWCRVAFAAVVRKHIARELPGMTCSVGVAHNRLLATLATKYSKPDGATLLRCDSGDVLALLQATPLQSVRNLKGQLGQQVVAFLRDESIDRPVASAATAQQQQQQQQPSPPQDEDTSSHEDEIDTAMPPVSTSSPSMTCLAALGDAPKEALVRKFGERVGVWLAGLGRGEDANNVTPKGPPKTIITERSFPPVNALSAVRKWVEELSCELLRRLIEDHQTHHGRLPAKMVVRWRRGYAQNDAGLPSGIRSATGDLPPAFPALMQEASRRPNTPPSELSTWPRALDPFSNHALNLLLSSNGFPSSVRAANDALPNLNLTRVVVGATSFNNGLADRQATRITDFFGKRPAHVDKGDGAMPAKRVKAAEKGESGVAAQDKGCDSRDRRRPPPEAAAAAAEADVVDLATDEYDGGDEATQDSDSVRCPVCNQRISRAAIEAHVNGHFDKPSKPAHSTRGRPSGGGGGGGDKRRGGRRGRGQGSKGKRTSEGQASLEAFWGRNKG
ncbi:unnamed protein product [Vitrella brassicaformis CCMP3155]|uniref:UmuC domain-containing protein n=3 Tax=Vitrella brassicaformis TaxID=1169539 RepID=A0A0G4GGB6_VITBC|nr:unnamed protein product [Vitrella brassicaformis CCMP3155]|eukprot:CEM28662.1 unnamed protein product [Vitrella brassicaformis CCMP3155]